MRKGKSRRNFETVLKFIGMVYILLETVRIKLGGVDLWSKEGQGCNIRGREQALKIHEKES